MADALAPTVWWSLSGRPIPRRTTRMEQPRVFADPRAAPNLRVTAPRSDTIVVQNLANAGRSR